MMAMVGHDGYIPVPTASRLLLLVVDPRHCCGRDAVVAWSAGEFDSASAERAGNVFEKDLHGRYVCGSTSLGVREDMAAHAAAGGFKDPCAGIARHFAIPYNKKIWAVPLDEMETSWLGGRVPLPDLEEQPVEVPA